MDDELQPLDYDQQQLLIYIISGNNHRRLKKPIYQKSLHLLFTNGMPNFLTVDGRYMYITDEGKDCLFQIAWGKRGITIPPAKIPELVKKGILVRGNQGYEWNKYWTWKYKYGEQS